MSYKLSDVKQAIIGSFLVIVVFLAIRGNNPFFFNPVYGFGISLLVIYIYYESFNGTRGRKTHFYVDILISFIVCSIMAYIFGLITIDQIFSFQVFGSLVSVSWWLSVPSALIFDKFNIINPLRRHYVRK